MTAAHISPCAHGQSHSVAPFEEATDTIILAMCFILGWLMFSTSRTQRLPRIRRSMTACKIARKSPFFAATNENCADAQSIELPSFWDIECVVGPQSFQGSVNEVVECSAVVSSTGGEHMTTNPVFAGSSFAEDTFLSDGNTKETADPDDFQKLLEAALDSCDEQLADAVLARACNACCVTWLGTACDRLRERGVRLRVARAVELARFFGSMKRADLAVDLFHANCGRFSENAVAWDVNPDDAVGDVLYAASLDACVTSRDFESACSAAQRVGWQPPSPEVGQAGFLALVRWLARRQELDRALGCYFAVRCTGAKLDVQTHRIVLLACVRGADMDRAEELFEEMVASRIADGTVYSAMICGHCAKCDIQRGVELFRTMKALDICPAAPVFDAILDGCAWRNMPDIMEQVIDEMASLGVEPSTSTLSIIMRLHGQNRQLERALAAFDEFPKKHGLELDGLAYGTLIGVCLKNNGFEAAWAVFEEMTSANLGATSFTYEALAMGCLRRGELEKSVRVVDETLGLAHTPRRAHMGRSVVEEILEVIGRRGDFHLGVSLAGRLQEAGFDVSDRITEGIARRELSVHPFGSRRQEFQRWRNFSSS